MTAIAQSLVEERTHSRMQISPRFEASSSSSSLTKKSNATSSSYSTSNNSCVPLSLIPTISIETGSSNYHIQMNIGYPSVSHAVRLSSAAEEI